MRRFFVLFLVISITLTGCTFNKSPEGNNAPKSTNENLVVTSKQEFVLGTLGEITVYSSTKEEGQKAIDLAYKRIRDIENLMSTSIEGSDVYNINKGAGVKPVKVDPSTMEVILKGVEYYSTTKKTFNIGLGSLINLWGIGTEHQKIPTAKEISEAKKHIDLSNLEISKKDNTVFIKDSNMLLDLGGIAKGYAVDEAMHTLKENQIKAGIVNLGGDIYTFGTKPDKSFWKVGITNPEQGMGGTPVARIVMTDKSIVTSGDYERYFVENDIRYHHIIDFETGMPADSGVVSVTVIADRCINADMISTAALVLGVDEGLKLIESQSGIEGFSITKDKEVYVSSGLKDDLEILDSTFKVVN